MEIYELLDKALDQGEQYALGYHDGFWVGRSLLQKRIDVVTRAIHDKHDELMNRWDWPE